VHTHIQTPKNTPTYAHTQIYTHTHSRIYTHTHSRIHTHTDTHTHIPEYTQHRHTHIPEYTHFHMSGSLSRLSLVQECKWNLHWGESSLLLHSIHTFTHCRHNWTLHCSCSALTTSNINYTTAIISRAPLISVVDRLLIPQWVCVHTWG